ncbi:uncharacterized protein LOC134819727 [Bolinopsis microptera]|uniref:uncharacterized protein LOC134819727 n=1 Tax=Bolinopsis microptera TaxID=2820187 RepID=UPI00307A11AE
MDAYGMNRILIVSWFIAVFLANITVFAVLMYKVQFKKKSRCLVLLSSLYYMIYSLAIAVFSFTTGAQSFQDVYCSAFMGSLCLSIILGNVFCVLGVTVERFVYIVYALQYKRIINSTRIMGFTIVIFLITMCYIVAATVGALKFQRVTFTKNKTVICTVDETSVTTRIVSYISLLVYLIAFSLVPALWLRIHFLRNNIKKICSLQNKHQKQLQLRHERLKAESQFQHKATMSPRAMLASKVGLGRLKNGIDYQKSPDIQRCDKTPAPRRSGRTASKVKRPKTGSQASFLSSTKSSKHTIKIFLVSFVVLKIQYVCFFPPFIKIIADSDNLPLVMIVSFADALFGCLILVAADVELKQIFFKFIRILCIEKRSGGLMRGSR